MQKLRLWLACIDRPKKPSPILSVPRLDCGTSCARASAPHEREQHGNLLPIILICAAVVVDQVSLFELDGEQDVRGCGDGEQEVSDGHCRRHPESEEPADIQRMPHNSIRP